MAAIEIDRSRPAPTITAQTPSPTNAQEVSFRVDFDKAIDAETFTSVDVSASSGAVSALTARGSQVFEFSVGVQPRVS